MITRESVFYAMKRDICKEINATTNLTELKEKMEFILNEWDLTEENKYYN